ncbi:MAG: hypothetical protein AUI11_00905 [Acidobacteria bacterium 13_2_20CM_2_66_4]|nr:MAG: hypothetical protein AUI11_00905 [Acidobacteria bacterium 13_2_20CM_2_66_4]
MAFVCRVDAQTLPSEPISIGGGRVVVSGDVSGTIGTADPGFFNFTDYDHSALRLMRVDVSATVNAGDHFAVLGEVRAENLDELSPYALFLRVKPWTAHDITIQLGRVPPTFGAFARRTYPADNPLIGYPLAYQYLTSLRPDSLPATADDLLRRRGLGWLDRFTIGNQTFEHGVPLVSAFHWDTGVQMHAATENNIVNGTVAVTAGGHDREFTQTAWGADVEYSRHYMLLRFETIVSEWRLPVVSEPAIAVPLRAVSTSVEGRYKLAPGLYVAARLDHLGFNDLHGTTTTAPWDAPVTRAEAGIGFSIQRNLLLKVSHQYNTRDGGPLKRVEPQTAAQLVFWF